MIICIITILSTVDTVYMVFNKDCIDFMIADMIPARVVLYMLSFSGFLVSFMMRTDINIAMVAMAKLPSTDNETAVVTSQCYTISNQSYSENTTVIRPEVRLHNAHYFFFYPCIIHFVRSSK